MGQIERASEKHIKNDPRSCRSVSIYLSREYTRRTLNEIAGHYGNTHHGKQVSATDILLWQKEDISKLA